MSQAGSSNPQKSPETHEHQEDVEDELANPSLYEDSMAEITMNETRDGGHSTDPFDRSDEYDEDVNLDAPPPITPDIPDVVPVKLDKDKEHRDIFVEEKEKTSS